MCCLFKDARGDNEQPHFVINLDLPHIERWREIIQIKKDALREFAYKYKEHIKISEELQEKFVSYGKVYQEYAKNLEAISVLADIDLPTLYTFNFMYDLENMGCTSVIVRQSDNHIYHARNLDYSF